MSNYLNAASEGSIRMPGDGEADGAASTLTCDEPVEEPDPMRVDPLPTRVASGCDDGVRHDAPGARLIESR